MFEGFKLYLNNWNYAKSERQKLQHCYLLLTISIVLLAGIISLFSVKVGHTIVLVALFTIAVYLANAIIWNLLQSALVSRLSTRPKRK
jgi:hypothetical protein